MITRFMVFKEVPTRHIGGVNWVRNFHYVFRTSKNIVTETRLSFFGFGVRLDTRRPVDA